MNTSMSVNQFFVSGLDIDGDGNQLHEFQSYYKMQSFSPGTINRHFCFYGSGFRNRIRCLKGKRFDGPIKKLSWNFDDSAGCNGK